MHMPCSLIVNYVYSRFYGGKIRSFKTSTFQACWKKCQSDSRCWTFAYQDKTKRCNLLKPRYCDGSGFMVDFKNGWMSGAKRCPAPSCDYACNCP